MFVVAKFPTLSIISKIQRIQYNAEHYDSARSITLPDYHDYCRLAYIVRLPWPLPTPSHCQTAMATADSPTLSDCHGHCRLAHIVRLPWPLPTRSHCQTAMATADSLH